MGRVQGRNEGYNKGQIAKIKDIDLKEHKISDHTFAGPDYSILPITNFPLMEDDWPDVSKIKEIEKKVKDNIELDFKEKELWDTYQQMVEKAKKKLEKASKKRVELLRNAAEIAVNLPKRIKNGQTLKFSVEVKSKINGHHLPGGLPFYRQIWLEMNLTDAEGKTVFISGDRDKNLDLRDDLSSTVRYGEAKLDRQLFNLQSKFYERVPAGTERHVIFPINQFSDALPYIRSDVDLAVAYGYPYYARIERNSLPPMSKKTATYKIKLPNGATTKESPLSFWILRCPAN